LLTKPENVNSLFYFFYREHRYYIKKIDNYPLVSISFPNTQLQYPNLFCSTPLFLLLIIFTTLDSVNLSQVRLDILTQTFFISHLDSIFQSFYYISTLFLRLAQDKDSTTTNITTLYLNSIFQPFYNVSTLLSAFPSLRL